MPDQICYNCKHQGKGNNEEPCRSCVSTMTMSKWEPVLC